MKYTTLGNSGIQVSRLAFGCSSYGSKDWMPWALSEEEAQEHYQRAFEEGFTFFDTADSYSWGASEEILGRAIKRFGTGRDRVVIATKVFGAMGPDGNQKGLSRKHIRHAIDDSLRRLGTDYVDLYQIHRLDPLTPMEEILEGLDAVVRSGKALQIGASSMHAFQFAKLQALAAANGLTRFVTMQNKYNLLYR
ncbi:aldo/keto reductase, partial [Rhizobiaceae sp. 2RAB30]